MRTACALLLTLVSTACVIPEEHFEPSDDPPGSDADIPDQPWTGMASNTDVTLRAIWGADAGDVYAVGDQANILHYDGQSWTVVSLDPPSTLRAIWGVPGGPLYIAGDGGAIWRNPGTDISGPWSPMTTPTGDVVFALWGRGSDVYAACGAGNIWRYDAPTDQWVVMNAGGPDWHAIWGYGVDELYAVGDQGLIGYFGGGNWNISTSGSPVFQGGCSTGVGTGIYVGASGTVRRYQNGNPADWIDEVAATSRNLNGVWAEAFDSVFAVGDSGIVRHFDGQGWRIADLPVQSHIRGVWGDGAGEVFVVGDGGDIFRYTP
jgi:hypothetical protein